MNKLLIKSLPTRRSSDLDVEQFGEVGAHHQLALARAPDRALAVIADRDDAGMRLDIALMHGLACIAALDRDFGFLPAGREVAFGKGDALCDIGGGRRLRI